MKEKIQEFLVGLVVTWIVFFLIVFYANPMYAGVLLPLGVAVIGVSLAILVAVRVLVQAAKRPKPVRPIAVPETSETASLKSQLEIKSEDASLHLALARKYMLAGWKVYARNVPAGLGYYEKAETVLAKINALEPHNSKALMSLASVHVMLKRSGEAEEEFLKAMELEPDNVEYKIVYARFLTRITEKYYEAEAVLKQSLSQPHSPEMGYLIHYYFHNVYERLINYGKKSERLTYRQNAESEYKNIFPEYEKGKYEVDFIRDKNAVFFDEAVLCGKIGLGVWKEIPDQPHNQLTYIKTIEIKSCLPDAKFS